jgi:hypothetical protein
MGTRRIFKQNKSKESSFYNGGLARASTAYDCGLAKEVLSTKGTTFY